MASPNGIVLVKDLTARKESQSICVKVDRLWKQNVYGKPLGVENLEMICVDQEGYKIHASVKSPFLNIFDKLLSEGNAIYVSNFGVAEYQGKTKYTDHRFKINFYRNTIVKPCTTFQDHYNAFQFVEFDKILNNHVVDNGCVDIIGYLTVCGDLELMEINGKPGQKLQCQIQDLKSNELQCTFWGEYARQINDYVSNDNSANKKIVIIVQYGRYKIWREKKSIQNGYFGTRLFINSQLPQINDFHHKLMIDGVDNKTTSKISLSKGTFNATHDEFLNRFPIRTIEEIRDLDESGYAVILASILCLETDDSWFYMSCRKCNKKVVTRSEIIDLDAAEGDELAVAKSSEMWCKTCKTVPQFVIPRFKVQVRVIDGSGSTSFIMFDREVSKLINKTARELVEVQEQAGDVDAFPIALEKLVGRKFAFKVEVADYNIEREWYVYTIVKMTDDKHVVVELLKKVLNSEESLNENSGSVHAESSVGLKDAFSVTGDNNTPSTVDKDTASSPAKRKLDPIEKPDFDDCEDTPHKKPKFDLLKEIKIEKP